MKHFFVINPHSFRLSNDLNRVMQECENCFSGGSVADYKIYMSRYPRDAIAAVHRYLTAAAPEEAVRVYAVGGDGILFDCLNGMVHFPNAELTNVPYGGTNDFVRAFGDGAQAAFRDIKSLTAAPVQYVDIIHCGHNYALIEVNIGLVAQAVIYANSLFRNPATKWTRRAAGLVYSLCAAGALLNDDEVLNQPYTITLDGEDVSGSYCDIHVANSAFDGGCHIPMPYAIPNDGILDVTLVDAMSKLNLARVIGDRNKGHFEKHKTFHHRRCRTLELKSEIPMRVQMDGESFYAQKINMEIIPNAVKFVAPEGMKPVDYSYRAYRKSMGTENRR
jgi:diacylglycerol kinase family enzyme